MTHTMLQKHLPTNYDPSIEVGFAVLPSVTGLIYYKMHVQNCIGMTAFAMCGFCETIQKPSKLRDIFKRKECMWYLNR